MWQHSQEDMIEWSSFSKTNSFFFVFFNTDFHSIAA